MNRLAAQLVVLAAFLLTASIALASGTPREGILAVHLTGISSLVESDDGVVVLYPNLADTSWLPDNFKITPGDLAYHQLRIYFSRQPDCIKGPAPEYDEAYPCHDEEHRRKMLNVTETMPGTHFELEVEASAQGAMIGADRMGSELPLLGDVLCAANWPRRRRAIGDGYLEAEIGLAEASHLAGRLLLPGLDLADLRLVPRQESYRLNRKVVPMAKAVTWKVKTSKVSLCFRELTADEDRPHRCLTWGLRHGGLHLLFEHQPLHVFGLGCLGGKKDFIAHYALFNNVDDLPALPLPTLDTGKKGEPGPADDAMCSPARVR